MKGFHAPSCRLNSYKVFGLFIPPYVLGYLIWPSPHTRSRKEYENCNVWHSCYDRSKARNPKSVSGLGVLRRIGPHNDIHTKVTIFRHNYRPQELAMLSIVAYSMKAFSSSLSMVHGLLKSIWIQTSPFTWSLNRSFWPEF